MGTFFTLNVGPRLPDFKVSTYDRYFRFGPLTPYGTCFEKVLVANFLLLYLHTPARLFVSVQV